MKKSTDRVFILAVLCVSAVLFAANEDAHWPWFIGIFAVYLALNLLSDWVDRGSENDDNT